MDKSKIHGFMDQLNLFFIGSDLHLEPILKHKG